MTTGSAPISVCGKVTPICIYDYLVVLLLCCDFGTCDDSMCEQEMSRARAVARVAPTIHVRGSLHSCIVGATLAVALASFVRKTARAGTSPRPYPVRRDRLRSKRIVIG